MRKYSVVVRSCFLIWTKVKDELFWKWVGTSRYVLDESGRIKK